MGVAPRAHIRLCQRTSGVARRNLAPMRALICENFEGIDSLHVGELPDPQPPPGSVLVKVEAAGVNFADTLMVSGQYQFKPETPFAPGHEVAGTVVVANNASGFSPGDRVCGFSMSGGIAEKAVLTASNVVKIPDEISFEVGAAIPVAYGTSYHGLVDRARLEAGESLLVLGAAGGVGLAAVQIGKALGASVIAAVSSEEKETAVREAGADQVIRHDQTPIRRGIDELTDGDDVDVVYDPVGGESTEQALRSTRWNGRLLVVGFASGSIPEIALNLPLLKGTSIVGVFWGRFASEEPERSAANNRQIVDWVSQGRLEPRVQRVYSLEDSVDALRWVRERKAVGKVVVTL